MFNKKILHTVILGMAVFYVVFPIIVFLYGWTKKPIAVCGCILCFYFMVRLIKELSYKAEFDVIDPKGHMIFWIVSVLLLALWVLFSGIGGFSYQTWDFSARNPMFHDLSDHPWPVYFNISAEPLFAREMFGSGETQTATYIYYFAWWLPVAALTKLFHWSRAVSDAALLLWAVLGVFLSFYCLVCYLKKYSYWILAAVILFGGMDFAMYVLMEGKVPFKGHVEWWAGYFQYSSNSAQLYWVFNQSIPIWVVMSLLLLATDTKRKIGLCSLVFAYSPFAAIGIIPIAMASCIKIKGGGKNTIYKIFKDVVSTENIGIPFMMLCIFGTFYLHNKNSIGQTGIIFLLHPEFKILTVYIIFLVMEVLIYFLLVGRYAWNWEYYWIILTELILIPLYVAGKYNDFAMRASIPAIYLMMVMVLKYLLDSQIKSDHNVRRRILAAAVVIGFLTSAVELQRNISITLTASEEEYRNDPVVSFEKVKYGSDEFTRLIFDQYLSVDYKDSLFYKYIAER